MTELTIKRERKTKETDIHLSLTLRGKGVADVATGIGFFDHMLTALAKHSRMDISLTCKGDLEVDDHHTVEDCALLLGQAFADAIGDKSGIRRFGYAYAPLDEALCRSVIDLSGRPHSSIGLKLRHGHIGQMATENIVHFFESFASTAKMTLHLDCLRGMNNHHISEAAFKAFALSLRHAVTVDEAAAGDIPSTKGTLS